MFAPQKKVLQTLRKSGGGGELVWNFGSGGGKGKTVARGATCIEEIKMEDGGGGEMKDWLSFREAGFLDEASLEKKDRQAMFTKVQSLEKELNDYQHHMGLLLLEKERWISNYEELKKAFEEVQEIRKREQTSHLIAFHEVEQREENLRNALKVEKQCVANLEKALHEIHTESKEIKSASDKEMSQAHDLVSNIASLTVDARTHELNAKIAKVNKKSSEVERKKKEVEAHESRIQNERQCLDAEKQVNEATSSKQKEELQNWENSLHEREMKQKESGRILSQREERAIKNDKTLKQEYEKLEEMQKKIETINLTLATKKEEVKVALTNLSQKEKDADATGKYLEMKEKELLALEEMLNAREEVLVKGLNEYNASVDLRKRDFDMEIDQKRKSFDEELKSRMYAVEQTELRVLRREEEISKREKALEKELETSKEKGNDIDLKWKALYESETAIRSEQENLVMEKKQLNANMDKLQSMTSALDKEKADIEEKQLELHKELERLKVTEEERKELQQFESELKHEKEKCMFQEELLMKEYEALMQDKENFEKEWRHPEENRLEKMKNDLLEKEKTFKEDKDRLLHLEEEISKRENALEKELEKSKEKGNDLDMKWKTLNESEKAIRTEQENLAMETKQLHADIDKLQSLNSAFDKEKADINEKQLELHKDLERLKVTAEERKELQQLQSELKHEKKKCMLQEELLMKEYEALKQDKEKFERDWRLPEENRLEKMKNDLLEKEETFKETETELNNINEKQLELHKDLERLKVTAEERKELQQLQSELKHEKKKCMLQEELLMKEYEALKQDKEKFEREWRLPEENRLEKMKNDLLEKEKTFKETETELNNINHLREIADREMKEMTMERIKFEAAKKDMATDKHFLERKQLELQKDIENLCIIIKKLRDQRERSNEFLKMHKSCNSCGEASHFILSDFQSSLEIEDKEILALLGLPEECTEGGMQNSFMLPERRTEISTLGMSVDSATSSGRISWLQKCTSSISQTTRFNRSESTVAQGQQEESPSSVVKVNKGEVSNEKKPSVLKPSDLFSVKKFQWDICINEGEIEPTPSDNRHSSMDAKALEFPEDFQNSQLKTVKGNIGEKSRHIRKRGRRAVGDAKLTLGKDPEESIEVDTEDSVRGESELVATLTDKEPGTVVQTPQSHASGMTSEYDGDCSEAHADSTKAGGRRKRKQTVSPASHSPGGTRYNLRPRKRVLYVYP